MNRIKLLEGKIIVCEKLLDFRIYKEFDEDAQFLYYSYEVNPEIRDEFQLDYHRGQILRAKTLEDLLFQLEYDYKNEFINIISERENPNY